MQGLTKLVLESSCDKQMWQDANKDFVFSPAGPVNLFLSKYGAKQNMMREVIQNIPSINNANYF